MPRRWLPLLPIVACLVLGALVPASACDRAKFKVVLDVGHSLAAPGATSARGRTEYSFNLDLAAAAAEHLKAAGFDAIVMTTQGDAHNLPERADHANAVGASLVLSLHHDSVQPDYLRPWTVKGEPHLYCDRFKGWSLFVSTRNANVEASLSFARLLGGELLAARLPFTMHHAEQIHGENHEFLDADKGVYRYDGLTLLRLSNAPAVLLESGIIVNRDEELALASAERRETVASAITTATERYCQSR